MLRPNKMTRGFGEEVVVDDYLTDRFTDGGGGVRRASCRLAVLPVSQPQDSRKTRIRRCGRVPLKAYLADREYPSVQTAKPIAKPLLEGRISKHLRCRSP